VTPLQSREFIDKTSTRFTPRCNFTFPTLICSEEHWKITACWKIRISLRRSWNFTDPV